MRSWALIDQNNNISSMITSWWASIKCVALAADMPATLRHSYRRSGGEEAWHLTLILVLFSLILNDTLRFLDLCSLTSSSWFLVVDVAISCCLLHDLSSSVSQFLVDFLSSSYQFLFVFYAISSLVFYVAIVLSLLSLFLHCDCLVFVVYSCTLQSSCLCWDCLVFIVSISMLRMSFSSVTIAP